MRIDGHTELIAHIGYPTHAFRAPLIYNPYFEQAGIGCVVVPMGCQPADFAAFLPALFALSNLRGALITMPHKMAVVDLLDEVTPAVRVAGACNAVRRDAAGRLIGDLFDGVGFVRGAMRKGFQPLGRRVLVVGCGGVGSAIAASLADAGVSGLSLYDTRPGAAQLLAERLREHHPGLRADVQAGTADPGGHDMAINATPLGMAEGDPLPFDVSRLQASTWVGEVVMKADMTPLLLAAQARGCPVQLGSDMLYEQIPAYLEFFGLPTTTPEVLRSLAWPVVATVNAHKRKESP